MAWRMIAGEHGLFRELAPDGRERPRIYMKLSIRGRPRFVSAKTDNVKIARQRRAEEEGKGARGETVVSGKLTVGKLCDALQAHYELHDAWNRTKRHALGLIRAELGKVHPAELVTAHHDLIEETQAKWKRAGLSNASVNRYCNYLRRALRFGAQKGRVGTIPIVGRLDESTSRRGKPIPIPDAERLLDALAPWVRAPFVLGYDYGIRRGQLCRTRREYVTLTPGREVIEWPPGGSARKQEDQHVVPLEGRVLELVREAMAVRKLGCPFLFHGPRCRPGRAQEDAELGCLGDFKTAVKAACRRAGIPYGRKAGGITFHSTRHSAATNLRAGGMEEADAMRFTGHKTAWVFRTVYDHGAPAALRARMQAARAELARQQGPARARAAAGAQGRRKGPRSGGSGARALRSVPGGRVPR